MKIHGKFIEYRGHSWIFETDKSDAKPIYIPPQDLNEAKDGDLVLARALPPNSQGQVVGKITSEKPPTKRIF